MQTNQEKSRVTIFTPTYNRAYCLPMLYESLQSQTCFDFEWLIVDDGSTDSTQSLVSAWVKEEKKFPIYYKKVENGGKHRAINIGIKLAKSPYFFIVDSDDQLRNDAVGLILIWFTQVNPLEYAGVSGNKVHKDGNLVGSTFSGKYLDSTYIDRSKYGITGDKAEAFYTSILMNYPFPEITGECFCPEALIWNRLSAAGYKMRWYNEGIYICEYLQDGLTSKIDELLTNNIEAYKLYCYELIKINVPILKKIACIGNYARRAKNAGMRIGTIAKDLQVPIPVVFSLQTLCRFYIMLRGVFPGKRA